VTKTIAATPQPPIRAGMSRGANVTAYSADALTQPAAAQALAALRATGATEIVLPVLWFQDTKTSTELQPDPLQTPSDASLLALARTAKAQGFTVGFAPHVNVRDGTFRGEIAPTSKASWFASYAVMADHYADLAAQADADLLVVGSELVSMSPQTAAWRAIIADVKTRYHGALTYAANWVQEAEKVGFWDALDSVGIDAYMPLTPSDPTPTVVQLQAAWAPWITRMQQLNAKTGKPVLLTEIGYTSRDGTAQAPATEGAGTVDQAAQATAYEGAFRALGQLSWISGMLIWDWSADGRESPGDYSPQGKRAQTVLTRWFGG
jgi:nucleotide-binding universal stress UspA family protein